MSFIEKTIRQVKGLFNDGLEAASDPGRTVRQIVRDLSEDIANTENAIAEVMAQQKLLEAKQEEAEHDKAQWHERARKAVLANREDLAKEALAKESEAEQLASDYRASLSKLNPQVEALRKRLQEMKHQQQETAVESDVLQARSQAAKASEKAAEIIGGIGNTDYSREIASLKDKVTKTEARAEAKLQLAGESNGKSLEQEIDRLGETGSIEDKLAALRKEVGSP
jgi:phage shock protein A